MLDAYVLPNKFSLKQVEKHLVGKPQKHVVQLLPNQEIEQEEGQKNQASAVRGRCRTKQETSKKQEGSIPIGSNHIFGHPSWLL